MLTQKRAIKKKIHPVSSIDGSPITVYTPRQEALLWWYRLTHPYRQRIALSLPHLIKRDHHSLTGREIEEIYKSVSKIT